jgi:hypothetical protein
MNGEERDDELLKEYLEGESELSRLYRQDAQEQPDPRLDARILAEARRAVSTRRRVVHSPFARHWLVPASLAAVLVLSVGVVVLMPDPALERDAELEQAAESKPAPAAVGAPSPADGLVPRRQAAESVEDAAADERAFEAAPAEPAAAGGKRKEAARKAGAQDSRDRDRATLGTTQSLPAAPAASGRMAEEASSAVAPAGADAPPPRPDPMPSDAVRDDPQAWLRFIEGLVEAQNRDGAISNLRAFRVRYPDVPLPAELASLAASAEAERP